MARKKNSRRADAQRQKDEYTKGLEQKLADTQAALTKSAARAVQLEAALIVLADKVGSGHTWYAEIMEVVGDE